MHAVDYENCVASNTADLERLGQDGVNITRTSTYGPSIISWADGAP